MKYDIAVFNYLYYATNNYCLNNASTRDDKKQR